MVKEGDIITGTYYYDTYRQRHCIIFQQIHPAMMENEHAILVKLTKNHQDGEVMTARLCSVNENNEMRAEEV